MASYFYLNTILIVPPSLVKPLANLAKKKRSELMNMLIILISYYIKIERSVWERIRKIKNFQLWTIHRNTTKSVLEYRINKIAGNPFNSHTSAMCTPNGTLIEIQEIFNGFGDLWFEYSFDLNFCQSFMVNNYYFLWWTTTMFINIYYFGWLSYWQIHCVPRKKLEFGSYPTKVKGRN